ncbi:MAG: acetyl-CoA carboxylase biotin carboxyl carrier protein [Thermoanaerobaculia bacterium]|nr:acetyl-CoA carboxylase biotin carboxyl carrier protein [Thermoanaerobaculia bacterium]
MSFKEIKELIALVSERGLGSIEVERAGFRLKVEGRPAPRVLESSEAALSSALAASATAAAAAETPASEQLPEDVHVITSPIVGTFYRSPSPESDPFAEVGQKISRGKILCIIESMKLMNEIESDVAGEIVEVYPRNGQPVEYGEKLFAVKLAA